MAGDIELFIDGLREEDCTVVRTHGGGAAMDTEFMNAFAEGLVEHGARVVRFEFPYMAQRLSRSTGLQTATTTSSRARQRVDHCKSNVKANVPSQYSLLVKGLLNSRRTPLVLQFEILVITRLMFASVSIHVRRLD